MLTETQLSLELAKLSHDINTPLTIISATAEVAKKMITDVPITEETSKSYAEYMDGILYNVRKLSAIIDNLRSLDELYDDVEVTESIIIEDFVKSFCKSLETYAIKHSFNLSYDIKTSKDTFNIRPTTMHRILLNLVVNSVKYNSKPCKKVKIFVTDDSENTYIKVSDNGDGIAPENLNRVTDIFFRAKCTNSNGEGLGLPIVKRCVERMNGTLMIESEENIQTTVTVAIPHKNPLVFRDRTINLTPSNRLIEEAFSSLKC